MMMLSLNAASDAPPERIAPHATGVAPYAQAAMYAYAEGYAFIERAARIEEDIRNESMSNRQAALQDMRNAYDDALSRFQQALQADARMYEAHTYVGYVQRKLGNHTQALLAYDAALALKPNYVRAIEYQGEAYLGLDRFDDAKRNYLRLYALDETQADLLLGAMHRWVQSKHESGHASADTKLAESWLKDRPSTAAAAELAHW
jgi:tetratricopeptide (TPR) repeat protein